MPFSRIHLRLVTQAFATRSSRVRHRLLKVGAIGAAAVVCVACGDDKVAAPQAVLWFGLSTTANARCSSINNYQLPMGARATVTGADGVGERVKDGGDNIIECDVRPATGSTTNYNVSVRFSVGEIGNFVASGVVAEAAGGTLDVDMVTGSFSLSQNGCTATVETAVAGAVWINRLSCPDLRDPSSPGIICDGQGGMIFENCNH
jgi:hypothetical protein